MVQQTLYNLTNMDDSTCYRATGFFAWTNYHSSVKSLKEVLPLLKQSVSTKPYTLVLMDCQMPVMDGYEVSAAIGEAKAGESLKDIPIVTMRA